MSRCPVAITIAVAAMALAAPSAHAAVPGAPGLGDSFFPLSGNGGYDVQRYDVNLRYLPRTRRVRSVTVIRAQVTQPEGLARFNLDFRGPRIRSLRVDGARAEHARKSQELTVKPASALAAGADFRVRVAYRGEPGLARDPDGTSTGWYRTDHGAIALSEPRGTPTWLPSNDHPRDKADFRIKLTASGGRTGVSNGRLVERKRKGNRVTSVWEEHDMAPYLALVAFGRYRLDRGPLSYAGDEGRQSLPYVGAIERSTRRPAKKLRVLRQRTRAAHRFMESVAGPYPFAATGGIIDFSGVGYALETQSRAAYPAVPSIGLVVHEIAHQWYGNSVSVHDWSEIWLNEGFATYMEWLYRERHGGPTAQQRFNELSSAGSGAGFWNPPPARTTRKRLFASSVYVRGAMALHVLRREIGDADFFELLARWAADNEGRWAVTRDPHARAWPEVAVLYDSIQSVTGQPRPDVFHDWLHRKGKPPPP